VERRKAKLEDRKRRRHSDAWLLRLEVLKTLAGDAERTGFRGVDDSRY
jgi:hypothetical protein